MRRLGVITLGTVMLAGCVGQSDYRDLEAKHGHLLDVKEQWEAEKSEVASTVEETRRSYHHMSMEQGALKVQMDTALQSLRSAKADLQAISNKVDGQGVLFREQQRQTAVLTDQFGQVLSKVAALAETNHELATRVNQLAKVTQQMAMKVDAAKKVSVASAKRASGKTDKSDEGGVSKEKSTEPTPAETPVATKVTAVMPGPTVGIDPDSSTTPGSGWQGVAATKPESAVPSAAPAPMNTGINGSVSVAASPAMNHTWPPALAPAPLPSALAKASEPAASKGRWEQLKDMIGKARTGGGKSVDAPAPTALSLGSAGEANAASFPQERRFGTISSVEGTPAPGAVIAIPAAPPVPKP